jgi:tetratricopeptide (TPR) repeat protein
MNNAAFALLLSDDVAAAGEILDRAARASSDETRATLTATRGLLAYRLGRVDEARALYRSAMAMVDPKRQPDFAALATIIATLEEVRIFGATESTDHAAEAAQRLAGRTSGSVAVEQWLKDLNDRIAR